jgi:kumamolisin
MPLYQQYVPLAGSERVEPAGARRIGLADSNEYVEVSVYLRSTSELYGRLPPQGKVISRDDYAGIFGVPPNQFAQVEVFARSHNLVVVEANSARRVMMLAGTVADMRSAFGVELNYYELEGHTYRIRTGHVNVPIELSSIIEGVFGLDNRPQARPFVKVAPAGGVSPLIATSYTPPQVADLYNFSNLGDGAGRALGSSSLRAATKKVTSMPTSRGSASLYLMWRASR